MPIGQKLIKMIRTNTKAESVKVTADNAEKSRVFDSCIPVMPRDQSQQILYLNDNKIKAMYNVLMSLCYDERGMERVEVNLEPEYLDGLRGIVDELTVIKRSGK